MSEADYTGLDPELGRAYARIAELEAEVARLKEHQFADHIIALEDEITRLTAARAPYHDKTDAHDWEQGIKNREAKAREEERRAIKREFGFFVIRNTNKDPDDAWDALCDAVLARSKS